MTAQCAKDIVRYHLHSMSENSVRYFATFPPFASMSGLNKEGDTPHPRGESALMIAVRTGNARNYFPEAMKDLWLFPKDYYSSLCFEATSRCSNRASFHEISIDLFEIRRPIQFRNSFVLYLTNALSSNTHYLSDFL